MDAVGLPLTVAGEVVVIGPRLGPEVKHTELVKRTTQWRDTPGWTTAPAAPSAASTELTSTAVQLASQHLRQAAPDMAAIVDRRDQRIHYLRLPGTGRMRWTGIRSLSDVSATSSGNAAVTPDAVARLTNPGSGLFAPVAGEPLTVDGTAVARLHIIGSPARHSIGWAPEPQTAVARALLAGVRVLSTRLAPAVPGDRMLVGAAGASELHWLLDGALRLLAAYGTGSQDRLPADDTFHVTPYRVPHLADDWQFARVFGVASGAPVAAAWGRTGPEAVRHALTAARVQLAASAPGLVCDPQSPTADAMLQQLSTVELSRLQHDVLRCLGRWGFRPLGARMAADALLGDPGLAWGVVWQA